MKEKINDKKVLNQRKSEQTMRGPMLPETRKLLDDLYRPFNEKLADLLDDQRFLWQ